MNKLTVKVEVEIDQFEKRTRYLLITAFEGGVGYWCQIEGYTYPPGTKKDDFDFKPDEKPPVIGKLQPFKCWTCGTAVKRGGKCATHPDAKIDCDYTPRYALIPTLKGGAVKIVDQEGENKKYSVDYYACVKAWQIVAESYPHVFARIKEEDYDASDADVWFQCAVFGEVIYG